MYVLVVKCSAWLITKASISLGEVVGCAERKLSGLAEEKDIRCCFGARR